MKDVVLLIGHGSRDTEGNGQFTELARLIQGRMPARHVESCFLEFALPNVQEGIDRCMTLNPEIITAVPVMLLDAGHFTTDIPAELARARRRYPGVNIEYGAHLGFHEKMMDLLLQCLYQEEEDPFGDNELTAVLMVGRGSSDPVANSNFYKLSRMLWERTTYRMVENCFIGITLPRLEEGLERCLKLGAEKLVVLPYFLFTGRLYKRIAETVSQFQTTHRQVAFHLSKYFGLQSKLVDVLEQRIAEAVLGLPSTAYDDAWMRHLASGRYGEKIVDHHGHGQHHSGHPQGGHQHGNHYHDEHHHGGHHHGERDDHVHHPDIYRRDEEHPERTSRHLEGCKKVSGKERKIDV